MLGLEGLWRNVGERNTLEKEEEEEPHDVTSTAIREWYYQQYPRASAELTWFSAMWKTDASTGRCRL